jgi:hypothetical protein
MARLIRAVLLLWTGAARFALATPESPDSIRLLVSGIALDELRGAEVVRWDGDAYEPVATALRQDAEETWLEVAAACQPDTVFVVYSPNHIGVVKMPPACGGSERVVLHPRATIIGRFTVDVSVSRLPASGMAQVTCDSQALEVPFAVNSSKPTELTVPADCGVVSLQVAKLAPVLIPPEALSPARPHRLGDVVLKHGASLLARVGSTVDREPIAELATTVIQSNDLERMRGAFTEDALRPLARSVTGPQGWVNFYAIEPSEIVLAFRRPQQRFPEFSERYVLDAGRGLVIDDLNVSPPASLAIRLDVPDALRSELVLTNVELTPEEGNRWPRTAPIVVPAATDGTSSMLEIPPGKWTVAAAVRLKDGFLSRSAARQLALAPATHEEVTLQIKDGVFRGRVLRGSEGLRGVLNLIPEDESATRRQATARTNDDGRFTMLLEGPGMYTVDFSEPQKGAIRFERYVEFADPSKEVEIRLPAGRIRGTVVHENGAPAANVSVGALRVNAQDPASDKRAMEGSTSTGSDGTFTIENLAGGIWHVHASMKGVAGDPVEVRLLNDSLADGVLLVVRQSIEVAIHVVDSRGFPVANAWVFVELPAGHADMTQSRSSARTGDDGLARIQLPRSAEGVAANVLVSTLDSRITAALLELDSQQIATIRLPAATGELRLSRLRGKWSAASAPRLVADDGASIPIPNGGGSLAVLGNDVVRLRHVPAGRWRYIEARTPFDALAIRTLRFLAVRPLTEINIRPGVLNEVEIPE